MSATLACVTITLALGGCSQGVSRNQNVRAAISGCWTARDDKALLSQLASTNHFSPMTSDELDSYRDQAAAKEAASAAVHHVVSVTTMFDLVGFRVAPSVEIFFADVSHVGKFNTGNQRWTITTRSKGCTVRNEGGGNSHFADDVVALTEGPFTNFLTDKTLTYGFGPPSSASASLVVPFDGSKAISGAHWETGAPVTGAVERVLPARVKFDPTVDRQQVAPMDFPPVMVVQQGRFGEAVVDSQPATFWAGRLEQRTAPE